MRSRRFLEVRQMSEALGYLYLIISELRYFCCPHRCSPIEKHHRNIPRRDVAALFEGKRRAGKHSDGSVRDRHEAFGSSNQREYYLSSKVYKRKGKVKEYVRQTGIDSIRYPELILKLVEKQGRVTKRDVAELLHLDPDGAYYEIRKLVTGGKLVSAKRGPDAYYVKPQMPPIENER